MRNAVAVATARAGPTAACDVQMPSMVVAAAATAVQAAMAAFTGQ